MRGRRVLSLCLTLLFAAHSGVAQQSTARLLGTVKDQTGAVIPGAMVKATNVGTGQERMIRTNEGGDYSIPLLPIGEYTLSVEAAGFKLVAEGTFWRNSEDTRDFPTQRPTGAVDNFVLKFEKPR